MTQTVQPILSQRGILMAAILVLALIEISKVVSSEELFV